MKARNMWIITGTIGVLGLGTGAAFAATPDTAGDADSARTTVTDKATARATSTDDANHGVTLTPDQLATSAVAPAVTHVDPAQPLPDSGITSLTLASAPSAVTALSPVSAPSPVSALSPLSAPSAPSAD
jgi:hypothetical protein